MIKYRLKSLIADKEFKESRRITYEEISRATNISRQTLSKISAKKGHNVRSDVIERLCLFFNITPEKLMVIAPDSPEPARLPEKKSTEEEVTVRL
ncbi:MAG: transcriptional regulator [Deltaproteobacteria bacterium]|nr:MAG: transcriptional regulator [Deltaproteobacteria bacterium]